jgi:hypothetical protein
MALDSRPFTLYGIREILDSYVDSPPLIETLINSTEQAVAEESPTTFELSKSLIDSACKTILTDRGVELNRNWDTPQLFRETQNQLNFIPPEHPNPQVFQGGITGVLQGLRTAIQGFAELRNSEGIIAHGQDGYRRILFFPYQLQFVARAADAIVHFLFSAHRRNPSGLRAGRIHYEDYPEFNLYTDEIYEGVELFGQIFTASLILFNSDKDHLAYKEMLIEWQTIEPDIAVD